MASTSSAHVLMKKGKRGAAAYVHSECASTPSPQNLNELLDIILNPSKSIDEWETIDWCKWLMAGGRTPDEFSTTGNIIFTNVILPMFTVYFVIYILYYLHLIPEK
jgi:hypothetical protein